MIVVHLAATIIRLHIDFSLTLICALDSSTVEILNLNTLGNSTFTLSSILRDIIDRIVSIDPTTDRTISHHASLSVLGIHTTTNARLENLVS